MKNAYITILTYIFYLPLSKDPPFGKGKSQLYISLVKYFKNIYQMGRVKGQPKKFIS